ncbi:MAG: ferritin-like domain-containing protein [Chitinophagaceae bacterium]
MSKINESGNGTLLPRLHETNPVSRRNFLGYAGGAAALAMAFTACDKNDNENDEDGINLGSGDVGILNYAYALEQLEAAFYSKVLETPYTSMPAAEQALLQDIRDHEIAHREFFKAALGSGAIQALTPNWGSLDFTKRDQVLATAKAFEDLGVAAYNGAGKLISTTTDGKTYLTLAGKIVSVEARHAAYIRDLISNGTFADSTIVDAMGLDAAKPPSEVLAIANTFLSTRVSGRNLPTS